MTRFDMPSEFGPQVLRRKLRELGAYVELMEQQRKRPVLRVSVETYNQALSAARATMPPDHEGRKPRDVEIYFRGYLLQCT